MKKKTLNKKEIICTNNQNDSYLDTNDTIQVIYLK